MSKKNQYAIERPINGIFLNGNEQMLDSNGDVLLFDSVLDAKQFIIDLGNSIEIVEQDLDNCAIQINEYKE